MKIEVNNANMPGEKFVVTLEDGDRALSPKKLKKIVVGIRFDEVEWQGQTKNGYQYYLRRSEKARKKNIINPDNFNGK